MSKYIPPHKRRVAQKSKPIAADVLPAIFGINLVHRHDKWRALQRQASRLGLNIQRWEAVDGSRWEEDERLIAREWEASINAKYSRSVLPGTKYMTDGEVGCALSHIALWHEAVRLRRPLLVVEDDAHFYNTGHRHFSALFGEAWKLRPEETGIMYLGFSSRGERTYVSTSSPRVHLYQPEYGYHTHAYVVTSEAAATLLDNLPVSGPLDVWLADNRWFGVSVCCAVVPGEGWRCDDRTYEGALLVSQRRKGFASDIPQSVKGNSTKW